MQIFEKIDDIKAFVIKAQNQNKTVGFVPTMGALHDGHLSLVRNSINQTDITIASIFVNPTQFNEKSDLDNYPRTFDEDCKLLSNEGCHALFYPDVNEMYPEKDERVFNFNGLDRVMEGEHRPGHFNGVAQIVSKLFEAVPANKAYFGLKDFQQLAIIQRLVEILDIDIEIIPCDIVREPDGLAMSSRNVRLSHDHRNKASIIYENLLLAIENQHTLSLQEIKKMVVNNINQSDLFEVEYFDIVNSKTLLSVKDKKEDRNAIGCIAVWADKIRLIDNIIFNF